MGTSSKEVMEIQNKSHETFSYKKGDVSISISVEVRQLKDLKEIIEQCLRDINEKITQRKS